MRRFDARYAIWGAAMGALALLPAGAGIVGVSWELGQMAGLLGCIGCVLLCGAPVRPRESRPPALLSLPAHTLIGWLALLAAALHVGGLIMSDRLVVEYLKPSAPLYQLAGMAASLVLLTVVVGGVAAVRRRLWRSHRGFQFTHVVLGGALIVLIAIHVIVSARYVGGPGRRLLIVGAMIGALLMLLRPRRSGGGANARAEPVRQLVFGRHSKWMLAVVTVLAMSLAGLMGAAAGVALREPLLQRSSGLPLDFPHSKHVAVNCITCHHNFADGRGLDGCIACHQSGRTDLKVGVEARFHAFCFECHRHPDAALERHGPVSGCVSCHHPGSTP